MEFEGHKQLNEFSASVDRHHTTINNWFNEMERRRIHYVNRQAGQSKERIFDIDDYSIAKFIATQREAKWSMDAIYEHIANGEVSSLNPRPFPPDFDGPNNTQLAVMEQMRSKFGEDLKAMLKEAVTDLKAEMLVLIPPPPEPEDPTIEQAKERDRYITRTLTELRLNAKLEEEAIEAWNKLPESERTRKKGFFGKEEDPIKRQDHIRKYVNTNKPARLMAEYGITEGK